TPRGDRMRVALPGLGLATAVRMVDGVHRRTTDGGLDPAPALGTGLAQLLQVVLDVAYLTDGRAALGRDPPHLAGAKTQGGVALVAGDQLHAGTGCTGELRALAGLHLDAVHGGTDRDVGQRQGVAGAARRIASRGPVVTGLRAPGGDDVAAVALHRD